MPRPHRTAPLLITALLLAGPVPVALSQSAPASSAPRASDSDSVEFGRLRQPAGRL